MYRCSNTYRNFREFLKHPGLDAVGVFTPLPLHAWMDLEAMKAGKHVISAVPAAMTIEELERILDMVKKTGLKYMMAETSYYRPEIITCREWSKEGKFGTIFYSEAEYHHEGLIPLMYDDRGFPTWRHGPAHALSRTRPAWWSQLRERDWREVQAVGWGDGHDLQTNSYKNPF